MVYDIRQWIYDKRQRISYKYSAVSTFWTQILANFSSAVSQHLQQTVHMHAAGTTNLTIALLA